MLLLIYTRVGVSKKLNNTLLNFRWAFIPLTQRWTAPNSEHHLRARGRASCIIEADILASALWMSRRACLARWTISVGIARTTATAGVVTETHIARPRQDVTKAATGTSSGSGAVKWRASAGYVCSGAKNLISMIVKRVFQKRKGILRVCDF